MSIEFACPYCEKVSAVPDAYAGKRGKCPACNNVIEVPDPNEAYLEIDGADDSGPKAGEAFGDPVGGDATKACPYCGESIKKVAKKCKYCNEFLDRRLKQERRGGAQERLRQARANEMPHLLEYALCLCYPVSCILSLVYLIQGYHKKGGILLLCTFVAIFFWAAVNVLIK